MIKRYLENRKPSYAVFAEVMAALQGCDADFKDRVLRPYEQQKRIDNGDVW